MDSSSLSIHDFASSKFGLEVFVGAHSCGKLSESRGFQGSTLGRVSLVPCFVVLDKQQKR